MTTTFSAAALENLRLIVQSDGRGQPVRRIVVDIMTKAECREWIAALRSGQYDQTTGHLRLDATTNSYCCLGVEKAVHPYQCALVRFDAGLLVYATGEGYIDRDVYARLPSEIQGELAGLNDGGRSFSEIADAIERELLPLLPGDE